VGGGKWSLNYAKVKNKGGKGIKEKPRSDTLHTEDLCQLQGTKGSKTVERQRGWGVWGPLEKRSFPKEKKTPEKSMFLGSWGYEDERNLDTT